MELKKCFIAGEWIDTGEYIEVKNKYDGSILSKVGIAGPELVDKAIDAADKARKEMAALTAKDRGEILDKVSSYLLRDGEQIARVITREAGKGLMFSRGEVSRSVENFKFAADEARRLCGELVPFDASATGANRFGYFKRYPIGVVGAITPFNFPLNLVAHKVGPAIAAGCPVILKPASHTPMTAIKLVELLLEAGLPPAGINLVIGSGKIVGDRMATSDKIAMITFTGSPAVGLEIRKKAGMKKTTLELGNNSAAIIHEDADLSFAAPKCAMGSMANSGQVCISVQRIYIHESRYEEFRNIFINAVKSMPVGDPENGDTVVGPMINESEAIRIEEWVKEAQDAGASITIGGKRNGLVFEPTIIENCRPEMKVGRDEVFAPVVCLMKYKTLEEAVKRVNDSPYGLQAGVFTDNIHNVFSVADKLDVGGVMINDMPTFRVDQMPYGGMKLSGTGREGPRFAIEEMTEIKTVMINLNRF